MDGFEFDTSAFLRGINLAEERFQAAAVRGMEQVVEDLHAESKNRAPMDEGDLRNTSRTEVTASGGRIKGEVIYSSKKKNKRGIEFDIALKLHEAPGQYQDPSTPGTGPKFLARPLKAKSARYVEKIAEEIRKELT